MGKKISHGKEDENPLGYSIIQTADDGFAIAGSIGYDAYFVKLDNKGDKQWERRVGAPSERKVARSVIQTKDGGYALGGYSFGGDSSYFDFYFIRFDAAGTLLSAKVIGSSTDDDCAAITQTSDGGFILAGERTDWPLDPFGDDNFFVVKLDKNNNFLWGKSIGVNGDSKFEYLNAMTPTSDGGFVLAGRTTSFGDSYSDDAYIVKINSHGNFMWGTAVGTIALDDAVSII